ncbi:CDP-alcohol phosphatidyltransferase family protein [Arthrobacter sp. zg-Y769]|uniref:CDP-alcohol phosphatidyltransferase family protein n=1 Tax=Arthrobacter sp. zg-Y769 TaxID=2894191 RepID=UPI001E44E298|nr:CDP-alcohol phosphatidyltransferase family protein [Arthrobacter sp. zg-Y769]MCC9205423.1 CDP-alcohol phosphatidyltransferase family protein [Arthrobacter sp. zg-Y769]
MDKAQKPGAGVPAYTRWINRRLARYAAAAAVALRVSPNLVTAASAVLSLCGLWLLLLRPPGAITGLAAAVLLAAGYVLDSADGQVARVTGRGGPAGEWLDHVVDAVRTPAIHLAVLGGWALHTDASRLVLVLPLLYCLLSAGHFMSQILAEQLVRRHGPDHRPEPSPSPLRSFLLLPADTGVLCWVFACWGSEEAFLVAYGCLFLFNLLAGAASMRRKYRTLVSL